MCVEFSPDHGRCISIVTEKVTNITDKELFEEKTWWELRPTLVLVPASSWSEIKIFFILYCKTYKNCDEKISSWTKGATDAGDK